MCKQGIYLHVRRGRNWSKVQFLRKFVILFLLNAKRLKGGDQFSGFGSSRASSDVSSRFLISR